ncbi:hypothetical protein OEA41_000019 [Lepraria neglecta]|uniref:Fungal-type protein kinase domain-containing protein n=1 Tax=Lepraria neglecta TaxID=209136 RepID=A0AAD9ZHX4_9LECA|nr:hypothetical protein OEA41_000019 [Lepraria neglecta]
MERPEEGELIKKATDKGVRNIARYYHHETVLVDGKNDDIIENVRRGLIEIYSRTKFKQRLLYEPESSASASESPGKGVAGRSPSFLRKRSSSSARMALPASIKRSCLSLGSRNADTPIYNRVHRRVITRDPGKTIEEASSLIAVLNGLIGAIKGQDHTISIDDLTDIISGHESLLGVGILYRNISTGNIILTEQEDDRFLIDLDLAIKIENDKASGAPGKTGTKVFIAIGTLLGEHHSPMHDLESFF